MEDLTSKSVAVFSRPSPFRALTRRSRRESTRSKRRWLHPLINGIPQPGKPPSL